MQDLNQIAKLNSEAHERDIPNQQAAGFYVVAEYHGLHYVGYTTHLTEASANAKACEIGNQAGRRAKTHLPHKRAEESYGTASLANIATDTLPLGGSTVVSADETQAVASITAGGGGDFAGGGATSSWDSSSSDTSVSSSDSSSSSSFE